MFPQYHKKEECFNGSLGKHAYVIEFNCYSNVELQQQISIMASHTGPRQLALDSIPAYLLTK